MGLSRNGFPPWMTGGFPRRGDLRGRDERGGIWNEGGETGFYGVDRAGHSVSYSPPWINGMKVWQIPMGWGTGGDSVAGQFDPNPTTQTFSLTEDGTFTIRKFNHEATRNIHGSIWCE